MEARRVNLQFLQLSPTTVDRYAGTNALSSRGKTTETRRGEQYSISINGWAGTRNRASEMKILTNHENISLMVLY